MAIFLEPYVKEQTTVVTDHIDRFSANGIVLESGKTLCADIIITATGLDLVPEALLFNWIRNLLT
jgi:cation diffusion facilitator CzcD-associated flavoprotein CzcO